MSHGVDHEVKRDPVEGPPARRPSRHAADAEDATHASEHARVENRQPSYPLKVFLHSQRCTNEPMNEEEV
eukprot:9442424-Pyramimonas_sp.AAC.1